jgi:sugar phosphate isomerase/epimerase
LASGTAAFASAAAGSVSAQKTPDRMPFRLSLNLGTLSGFNLSLEEEIDVAAKAGYRGIEPWSRKIEQFLAQGGKLADVRKRIDDHGLIVEGLVTFFQWMVDDDTKRAAGIEQMKKDMDFARQLGSKRVAATASGVNSVRLDDFRVLGERYCIILEIGDTMDVVPMLEIWGASQTLNSLADAAAIAAWSAHPKAAMLLDVYHMFRGGSPFEGLALLNGKAIGMFHMNDYPAEPERERLNDGHRVYCGDGIAPLQKMIQILRSINYEGCLSFEVFNQTYWKSGDPILVAKTGFEKMNALFK